MVKLVSLIFTILPVLVSSENILMYLPIASRSYVCAWEPLVIGLAKAGHNVLFVTRFSLPAMPNLTQIEVQTDEMQELEDTLTQKAASSFNITGFIDAVSKTSTGLTKTHQHSLELLRYQLDKRWHLIITSPFLNEMGIILGHYLDIPNVQFLPANAEMLLSYGLGHPDNGAWSSNLPDSTFGRLIYILLNAVYADFVKPYFFVYPQIDLARQMLINFSLNEQDYWKLERNADFSFYMSSILMDNVNPRLPNTAQIGFIHCRDGKPLPPSIDQFYKDSEDTIIYISFGSLIKPEMLGNRTLDIFKKVMKGRRVVWKINGLDEDKDILTGTWFPQQDILAQNKTSIFISQCGLMSIQEAIYHHVPLLCIPVSHEQTLNSAVIERKGLGLKLDSTKMTENMLLDSIEELLNNKSYKLNHIKTLELIMDRPTPILKEAIFWVEHVLRHDGADHLKSRRRYMSMVEFYHLDVMGYMVLILSISSILSVGWWLLVLAYVKKIIKFLNRFRIHSSHIDSTTETDRKTGKERHEVSENALNNADNDSKNCDNKSSNAELERVVKSSDNCSVSSLAQLSKSFLENNYSNNNKG